jgi:integrase
MFTKAADWKIIDRSTIPKVKMLKENNKRLRYLAKDECRELVEACDFHLKLIVITALNTGMRRAEILGLTWNRVDLNHGFILLDLTKSGERREIPYQWNARGAFQELTAPSRCALCLLRSFDRQARQRSEKKLCVGVQKGKDIGFSLSRSQTHLCFSASNGRDRYHDRERTLRTCGEQDDLEIRSSCSVP